MQERIAVIGLGYVGLPVAVAMANQYEDVIGFDIDATRVRELQDGRDRTAEVTKESLAGTTLRFSHDPDDLAGRSLFIVAVPTPVDDDHRPDLNALVKASETVGRALSPGAVVVFESTVYPGATEEICGPAMERVSGLRAGTDFFLGYSPERINPGDQEHTFERITKVVAATDPASLERIAEAYGRVVRAGIHRAPSIKVAEAAKVIENTQRDLNIALMNELAIICHRLGIRTADVLEAAGTKWNFLPFSPGLVGGHCIGVDPYYLTAKAEQLGYQPEVILAGRRINNQMGEYTASTLVRLLDEAGISIEGARVGVLGLTFKENVPDLRNSRVPDIIRALEALGAEVLVHDALASPDEARVVYDIELQPLDGLADLQGLVLAVPHQAYLAIPVAELTARLQEGGVLIDVKSVIAPDSVADGIRLWSL